MLAHGNLRSTVGIFIQDVVTAHCMKKILLIQFFEIRTDKVTQHAKLR